MKTVWIAITLLLIVLVGAFSLFFYTTALYSQLIACTGFTMLLKRGLTAQRESEQLKEIWTRTDASWTPIMDHRQVDHLDESSRCSLARVKPEELWSAGRGYIKDYRYRCLAWISFSGAQ